MELDQLSEGWCAWVFAVKGSWTQGLGDPSPSSPVPKPVPGASRSLEGWASSLCKLPGNASAALRFRRRLQHLSAGFTSQHFATSNCSSHRTELGKSAQGKFWNHLSQEIFYCEFKWSQTLTFAYELLQIGLAFFLMTCAAPTSSDAASYWGVSDMNSGELLPHNYCTKNFPNR